MCVVCNALIKSQFFIFNLAYLFISGFISFLYCFVIRKSTFYVNGIIDLLTQVKPNRCQRINSLGKLYKGVKKLFLLVSDATLLITLLSV